MCWHTQTVILCRQQPCEVSQTLRCKYIATDYVSYSHISSCLSSQVDRGHPFNVAYSFDKISVRTVTDLDNITVEIILEYILHNLYIVFLIVDQEVPKMCVFFFFFFQLLKMIFCTFWS